MRRRPIDADAVLALTVAAELFETVAWHGSQIAELLCGIEHQESFGGDSLEALEAWKGSMVEERFGVGAAKALDHDRTTYDD